MNLKKTSCIKCSKYRKLKNPNIPNIFYKALVLSIICNSHISVAVMMEKVLKKKYQLIY